MFVTICLGCVTNCVKAVLVSCIPHLRYSAINCMFSDIAQTRQKRYLANFLLIGGAELEGIYYFHNP